MTAGTPEAAEPMQSTTVAAGEAILSGRRDPAGEHDVVTLALSVIHQISKNAAWVRSLARRIERRVGDQEKLVRDVDAIRGLGDDTLRIARDFLDAVRDQKRLSPGGVAVADCASIVARDLDPRFASSRVHWGVEGDLRSVRVPADVVRALTHVIENGLAASEPSGVVSVEASIGARGLSLVVRDTGSGMSSATLRSCCDLGFTTRADAGGTGVGLTVVRGLVGACGGALGIESTPGAGTVVEIVLPLAQQLERRVRLGLPSDRQANEGRNP